MSIQDITAKFKGILARDDVFTAAIVILVAVASFGLGRASVEPARVENLAAAASMSVKTEVKEVGVSEKTPVIKPTSTEKPVVEKTLVPMPPAPALEATGSSEGAYVGSKNGTKYHLPWCGSAKSIKEENRVWFESKEEAESAGYTPAANCKGI